jgi:hypothetical protein
MSGPEDPSVWSQQQQEQFMRALMGAGLGGGLGGGGTPDLPRIGNGTTQPQLNPPAPDASDPMMQLMTSLMGGQTSADGQPGPFSGMMNTTPMAPPAPPKPKTLIYKLLPIVHILASFLLLLYFVLRIEPAAYGEVGGPWVRWHDLRKDAGQLGWSLKAVVSASRIEWTVGMLTADSRSSRLSSPWR